MHYLSSTRKVNMKTCMLVLLCVLACASCTRPQKTLSDGQLGYAVYCEVSRTPCMRDIVLLCRDKNYTIVTERADEVRPEGAPAERAIFHNRYWMEARCD